MTSARAGNWPPRFLTSAGGGYLPPTKRWPLGLAASAQPLWRRGSPGARSIVALTSFNPPAPTLTGACAAPVPAGRKSAVAHQPGLPAALEGLIEAAIRGDPCSPLRWVSRSQRQLVKALADLGFKVNPSYG